MMNDEKANSKFIPTKTNMREIERNAMKIRKMAGVGEMERFDPFDHLESLKLEVLRADEIDGLNVEDTKFVKTASAKIWSARLGLQQMPNGNRLLLLNPNQTVERARVSILEEVAHVLYEHKPTIVNGLLNRQYSLPEEDEAYQTAAAALIPSRAVGMWVWEEQIAEDLAAKYGASIELAEMRIKMLQLWPDYKAYTS